MWMPLHAALLPVSFNRVSGTMQGEGQQGDDRQHTGQGLFGITEAIFEAVSLNHAVGTPLPRFIRSNLS